MVFINLSTHSFNLDRHKKHIFIRRSLQAEELTRACDQVLMNSYLNTEKRLRKAETVHYVNEVIQCAVEDSV